MKKILEILNSKYTEKKLKYKIFLLRTRLVSKRLKISKENSLDFVENATGSDLRRGSRINIKYLGIFVVLSALFFTGAVFAQSATGAQTTLNQCAPQNGSGISVWESCGSTPALFQSTAIAILGNYTQYQNAGTTGFHYTGGYGAMGVGASLMGDLYANPTASGVGYFAYLYNKSGLAGKTYAATNNPQYSGPVYGFSFLSPIYPIWAVARNLAYIFLLLIIVVTGILIIIGGKVGGQVPITFMSALPNIIAAIFLITFSYAIGGFMIDLMNIILGFIFAAFSTLNGQLSPLSNGQANSFPSAFSSRSYVYSVFGNVSSTGTVDTLKGTSGVLTQIQNQNGHILATIFAAIGKFITGNSASQDIIVFIVSVILLFTLFKIIIKLLKGYIIFLFLPVVSPFLFLIGAIPGQSKYIGTFFKGMLKAVAIFVTTYTIFNLIYYLLNTTQSFYNGNSLPLLGLAPLVGSINSKGSSAIAAIIAISLFVLIPKLVDDVTKALGYDFSSYVSELKRGFLQPTNSLRGWYGSAKKTFGVGGQ
jgi:hypothetical protein